MKLVHKVNQIKSLETKHQAAPGFFAWNLICLLKPPRGALRETIIVEGNGIDDQRKKIVVGGFHFAFY